MPACHPALRRVLRRVLLATVLFGPLVAADPAAAQAVNDFRLPPGPASPGPAPVGPPTDGAAPRPRPTPSADPPDAAGAAPDRTGTAPAAPPPGGASGVDRPRVILPAAPPPPAGPPTAAAERTIAASRNPAPHPADRPPLALPRPTAAPSTPVTAPAASGRTAAARPLSGRSAPSPAAIPAWAVAGLAGLVALAGLAAVGLGTAALRRWRPRPAPTPPAPTPADAAPRAPAPRAAKPAVAAADPASLAIRFEPLRMSLSLVYATLQYRLTLSAPLSRAPGAIAVRIDMVAARASADEAALLTAGPDEGDPAHGPTLLEAGAEISWTGAVRLRLDRIAAIRRGPALLFVPLVRIAITHGDAPQQAALVVGEPVPSGDGRLGPFRLDLAPRIIAPVAARIVALPDQPPILSPGRTPPHRHSGLASAE